MLLSGTDDTGVGLEHLWKIRVEEAAARLDVAAELVEDLRQDAAAAVRFGLMNGNRLCHWPLSGPPSAMFGT
jgi:hypothetical protein